MVLLSELAIVALVVGAMCLYAALVNRVADPTPGHPRQARAATLRRRLWRIGIGLTASGGITTAALVATQSFELP